MGGITIMRLIIPLSTMYEYDNTIFDDIYIKGVSTSDFIDHFLLSYGDMTPIYPFPSLLKRNIALTAQSLKWSIDKLYQLTQLEYNPIHNYDRHEEWNDSMDNKYQKGTINTESSFQKGNISTEGEFKKGDFKSDSTFQKGTISLSNTSNETTTHKVAAFNASDLQVANGDTKDSTAGGTETHGEDTTSTKESFGSDTSRSSETHGVDTTSETVKNDVDTTTETNKHTGYMYGNIGVTTTQSMMLAEHSIAQLNYIDDVCKLYADRLLISVW